MAIAKTADEKWADRVLAFCQRQSEIENDAAFKDELSKVLATRPKPKQKQRQRPKAKAPAKAKTKGTSLAHDFVRELGEDALEVGSRLWVTRWRTAAGELLEDSVKVGVFLRRKAAVRKQLKRTALDPGCDDLSESLDDQKVSIGDGST